MDISERLKELRVKKGYSQAELADKLHISKSTISMIEAGSRKPSYELMEVLADFFNVSLDYLRGEDDKSAYYLDPEVAELAKVLYERPEMRVLFDASRNATTEDVQMAADLLDRLSKK